MSITSLQMKGATFWRTIDKAGWGPGEWQSEPDKAQWYDPRTGMACLIVRNHYGALCGYAAVEADHPLHGQDYGVPDVDVHGGLTFSGPCSNSVDHSTGICHIPGAGRTDDVWWFGFDCVHWRDFRPGYRSYLLDIGLNMNEAGACAPVPPHVTYRNFNLSLIHISEPTRPY